MGDANMDLLRRAWDIISKVDSGFWERQGLSWQTDAELFRRDYFAAVDDVAAERLAMVVD